MPNHTEPGIYIETKDVSGFSKSLAKAVDKQHLYLVYQAPDGTRRVIRGGPEAVFVGSLVIQNNLLQAASYDKNPNGEKRPSLKLDIDPDKLDQVWAQMVSDANEIDAAKLSYDSWPPFDDIETNSNSVVRRLIEKQGLDPEKSLPPGVKLSDIPGYENNLEAQLIFWTKRQEILTQNLSRAARRKALLNLKMGDFDIPVTSHDNSPKTSPVVASDTPHQDASAVARSKSDVADLSPYPGHADAVRAAFMPNDPDDGDDFDTLLLKSPDILTEDEATRLGQFAFALPSNDPRKNAAQDLRRDFYDFAYSNDPVEHDASGRMIEPTLKREIAAARQPAKTPTGETVQTAMARVATDLADVAGQSGKGPAVMALQIGLQLLGERLKVDGEPGPKTRGALTRIVAKRGADQAKNALALGQVQQFAKAERNGGSASGLKDTVEKSVQPLFGIEGPRVAAETLQESLNDLQAKRAQNRVDPEAATTPPLKVDGDIGPKTTDAFRLALAHDGPALVTKTYGQNFGFDLEAGLGSSAA